MSAAIFIALIAIASVALLLKLFWPNQPRERGPDDNWAQRNDQRMPSLEKPADAKDNAVDAAVAAQDMRIL